MPNTVTVEIYPNGVGNTGIESDCPLMSDQLLHVWTLVKEESQPIIERRTDDSWVGSVWTEQRWNTK
jgi:hypothetical protein